MIWKLVSRPLYHAHFNEIRTHSGNKHFNVTKWQKICIRKAMLRNYINGYKYRKVHVHGCKRVILSTYVHMLNIVYLFSIELFVHDCLSKWTSLSTDEWSLVLNDGITWMFLRVYLNVDRLVHVCSTCDYVYICDDRCLHMCIRCMHVREEIARLLVPYCICINIRSLKMYS